MSQHTTSAHAGVAGLSTPGTAMGHEVTELLDATGASVLDCIRRSAVFRRMSDGTLPFAGRAAYLEQHWEGLRILRSALSVTGQPGQPADVAALAPLRTALASATEQFSLALDRAHATARWRDCHVTMPSILQFRRHITELQDSGDVLGLVAHAYLRLLVAEACPAPSVADGGPRPLQEGVGTFVADEEALEQLSEELSVALLLVMQHGSDVCRGYHERDADSSCAVTVSTIRSALK